MKTLGSAFAVLLIAGVALAGERAATEQKTDPAKQPAAMGAKAKATKEYTVHVVSTDSQARTITFKKHDDITAGASREMTLPVDSQIGATLGSFSAGDQVKLVCRTDDSGKEIVSRIEKVTVRPTGN